MKIINVLVCISPPHSQTTETFTTTISTDRYCYTTEKKLLGPKTKECESKRAIDTAIIMGLSKTEKHIV